MHPLDIISDSPHLYILQKSSNKTNFGGFLFFIYLIIIILIFVTYLIDYIQNDKYIIQSFSHFNLKSDEDIKLREKDNLYNPNINFKLDLRAFYENEEQILPRKFMIYDNKVEKFVKRNEKFNKRITDFDVYILYECDNLNCSDYYDFAKLVDEININYYYLRFQHDGFLLAHQNPEKPIIKTEDNGKFFFTYYRLNINKTTNIMNYWKNIIYTEKKGFFQMDSKDSCGYVENWDISTRDELIITNLTEIPDKIFAIISHIEFEIDNNEYTEYLRKRISELDILANIFSLVANIFTGVKFIFGFYSQHFNNFKIMEKILNKQTKKVKINEIKQMSDFVDNKFISIQDDLNQKCLDKGNKENDDYENNEEVSTSQNARIKKLHFFDFFLNNLYICCKQKKPQKIIHTCNQIVYKYASIETIIKNQILIENILKDYKWNDPYLNNVENNNLFIQLKSYL